MAKFTQTITADGDTAICQIDRRRGDANNWQATAFIYGTFGSGTVLLKLSPDQGTTKIAIKDWNGTAISATSSAVFTTQPVGNGAKNSDFITLYASVSGSSAASIKVDIFDNR